MDKEISKKLPKFYDFIKRYLPFPLLVYIIGFIYVQGMLSPYVNNDIQIDSVLGTIPASSEFYVINGLAYMANYIFFPIILAIPLLFGIIETDKNIEYKISYDKRIRYRKIKLFVLKYLIYFLYVPLIVEGIQGYQFMKTIDKLSYNSFHRTLIITNIICYLIIILITLILIKTNKLKQSENYMNAALWFLCMVCMLIIIYFQGIFGMIENLNAITSGEKSVHGETVYLNDKEIINLMAIDTNGNFSIGINPVNRSLNVIPAKSISKISMWDEKFDNFVYQKYNPNKSDTEFSTYQKQILALIKEYFDSSIYNTNANKFVHLFTHSFYRNKFQLESPSILEKDWKLTKQFNGNNINEFDGYNLTVPVIGNDKSSTVYVFEYWKGQRETFKFKIVEVNSGKWKIDDIQPYIFFNVKLR
ncbi:hypothetical protein LSG31_13530 [Fodinisporobacter ferrooxydans]|uniref:DUF3828 domain-containing protein n=1 Tax=Fodinisporobacter ferrooxydans TaxID=2901836 RepID=A0ABY4CF88_9BACL|nr:hypothetical protein LSG31_13530 [Alicyclobacillaceae bacterium MYW30-H2]